METSTQSQLAIWAPERVHVDDASGSYDMLKLKCASCKQTFWVAGNWIHWAPPVINGRKWSYRTRPCPYCFRPSWLPEQPVVFSRRRVVRRKKSKR